MTFAGYSKELIEAKYPNLLFERAQLLETFRTDHPELRKVDDDKLFAAISEDYPAGYESREISDGFNNASGGVAKLFGNLI